MSSTFHAVKSPMKRWKIVLIVIACILVLPVILVVSSLLVSPIFGIFDKAKFEGLDRNSQAIFDTLKLKSYGSETWSYTKKCDPELTGDWPTGKYYCWTKSAAEVPATDVSKLTRLHDKYFAIIDNSTFLKTRTQLNKQFPDEFGVKFTVSSAEKEYNMIGNDVICTYFVGLGQLSIDLDNRYGAEIANKAKIAISLTCSELASGDWYH